jgi:hypothetical protein
MKRLIDNVFQEDIIKSLMEQGRKDEQWTKALIDDRNKRIAELDRSLANPELRDSMKRDLRTWRKAYRDEIKMLVNRYNLNYE